MRHNSKRGILLFSGIIFFVAIGFVTVGYAKSGRYEGKGEVVTVDPVFGRITIQHGAIKGLSGDEKSEFFVSSPDLLKGLGHGDLVDFVVMDEKGDTQITGIKKTGVAPPKDERLLVGKVMQDVLQGTSDVARTVTSPIPPASDALGGTLDATAEATGNALKDVSPEVKQKF